MKTKVSFGPTIQEFSSIIDEIVFAIYMIACAVAIIYLQGK